MTPEQPSLAEGVDLSGVESIARVIGVFEICSMLESVEWQGDSSALLTESIRNALLAAWQQLDLERFLTALAPDEELFRSTTVDRAKIDPRCFTTTLRRLIDIRKQRGILLAPQPDIEDFATPALSALENLSWLLGMFSVFSINELIYRRGGLSFEAHMRIAHAFIGSEEIDKYINVFLPTTQWREDGKTPGFSDPLLERIRNNQDCFLITYKYLAAAHKELFPQLAGGFIEKHFPEYALRNTRSQVRKILHLLQQRLIARGEAVESCEYHRLEAIDRNSEQLLTTLKQYGIEAATYDQAEQAYKHRFVPPAPPKNVRDEIRQRIRSRARSTVELLQDCMEEIRANPEWEDYIREEYQTEIDELGGTP